MVAAAPSTTTFSDADVTLFFQRTPRWRSASATERRCPCPAPSPESSDEKNDEAGAHSASQLRNSVLRRAPRVRTECRGRAEPADQATLRGPLHAGDEHRRSRSELHGSGQ